MAPSAPRGASVALVALALGCTLAAGPVHRSRGGLVRPGDDTTDLPGCWVAKISILMEFGEQATLADHCLLMTCRRDRAINFQPCRPAEVPPGCSLSEYNMTFAYPACCPRALCPSDDTASL